MHFLTKFLMLFLLKQVKTATSRIANYVLFVLRVTPAPRSLTSQSARERQRERMDDVSTCRWSTSPPQAHKAGCRPQDLLSPLKHRGSNAHRRSIFSVRRRPLPSSPYLIKLMHTHTKKATWKIMWLHSCHLVECIQPKQSHGTARTAQWDEFRGTTKHRQTVEKVSGIKVHLNRSDFHRSFPTLCHTTCRVEW